MFFRKAICSHVLCGNTNLIFSRELTINNGDLQLVLVVAYHVQESPTFLVGPLTLGIAPDFTKNRAHDKESEGSSCQLKTRKMGPPEILGKINANGYRLALHPHVHVADVFNVNRLFKFEPGDVLLSGFVDESLKGGGT